MVEKALTEALIIAGGYADSLTPIDLGTLINSRYRIVRKEAGDHWVGRYGYTAAYAAAVHAREGKLKTTPPTPRSTHGFISGSGKGNFWDGALGPGQAEPQWLEKGFEESIPDIYAAMKRNLKV